MEPVKPVLVEVKVPTVAMVRFLVLCLGPRHCGPDGTREDRGQSDRPRRGPRHAYVKGFGIKLENVTLNMLGRAKMISIEKENTAIIDGVGSKAEIDGLVAGAQIEETHLRL